MLVKFRPPELRNLTEGISPEKDLRVLAVSLHAHVTQGGNWSSHRQSVSWGTVSFSRPPTLWIASAPRQRVPAWTLLRMVATTPSRLIRASNSIVITLPTNLAHVIETAFVTVTTTRGVPIATDLFLPVSGSPWRRLRFLEGCDRLFHFDQTPFQISIFFKHPFVCYIKLID